MPTEIRSRRAKPARAEAAVRPVDHVQNGIVAQRERVIFLDHRAKLRAEGVDRGRRAGGQRVVVVDDRRAIVTVGRRRSRRGVEGGSSRWTAGLLPVSAPE